MSDDMLVLRGDGSWPWNAFVNGEDIEVVAALATCFGGGADPQDNGETASGVNTKLNPNIMGCALPMIYTGSNAALLKALGGSPIPRVPWKTLVQITEAATGKILTVPVIDLGPAKKTGNAIDLTIAAARHFKPGASATHFAMACHYKILGGAKYLKGKGSHV